MPPTLRGIAFGVLLCFALPSQSSCAQVDTHKNPCDPNLKQLGENPNGYKLRGDRCEGIYVQPVSGTTALLVASFTESYEDYDPSALGELSIEWSSPTEAPVRLRAYALREKLYYQMDAIVDAGNAAYVWPGDILNALHLSKWDVGLVGFIQYSFGQENRTVYVPLRIRHKDRKPAIRYQMVLVPGSELTEVFLSLALVGSDGKLQQFLISDRPLRKGYYPAERGISFDLPALTKPGVYYLEIGATTKYGGPITQRVWFYHAGRG